VAGSILFVKYEERQAGRNTDGTTRTQADPSMTVREIYFGELPVVPEQWGLSRRFSSSTFANDSNRAR
jgi:hypothetical protein